MRNRRARRSLRLDAAEIGPPPIVDAEESKTLAEEDESTEPIDCDDVSLGTAADDVLADRLPLSETCRCEENSSVEAVCRFFFLP